MLDYVIGWTAKIAAISVSFKSAFVLFKEDWSMLFLFCLCSVLTSDANCHVARRKSIIVKIETTQREQLFSEMRKFADIQGFAIRIAPTSPNGTDYIVEMWREDTNIIVLNSFDPGTFSVDFYDTDSAIKSPDFVLNSLVSDFKSYINEIPNAKITEEK